MDGCIISELLKTASLDFLNKIVDKIFKLIVTKNDVLKAMRSRKIGLYPII